MQTSVASPHGSGESPRAVSRARFEAAVSGSGSPDPQPQADANQLAESHVPLVVHLVRETMARVPAHVDRDDLHSAGLVALVKASQSFQADRGVAFGAYATARIRGALLDELRAADWASRSVRRKNREIENTRNRVAAVLGQFPDDVAVARALGIGVEEVARVEHEVARASIASLDAGSESPLAQMVRSSEPSPECSLETTERLEYLSAAVAELPERLRLVVEGYFLEERPMSEIAADLQVTDSRVSQLRGQALVLLRDALNAALDPDLVKPHARPGGVVARRRDAYAAAVAARHASARRPSAVRLADLAG